MQPLLDARGVEDLQTALRDYTVDGLHELVGFAGQLALARGELDALDRCLDDSPLGDLVRLFLLGQALLSSRAARALAPLDLARAEEGGLISQTSDVVIAGVDLRPYAEAEGPNWWVLSDFGSDVRPGPVAPSHVLGIGAASISLAQATVRSPVARSLDVGTGCGIQSLHLSRHSAAVTATDVSSRALRLAATTAALNGLDWDLRQGSLLEPVGADEYDLIVANPPFVLSPGAIHYDYRDGGLPGDELCRRLVSGLPARLRPGGTAQLLANWAIGPEQSWDERVSGWLDGSNCSAWIWQREVVEPSAYVTMWLRDSGETPASPTWNERYGRWLSWFESAGIVAIGMGLINIRAHPGPVVCEDVPQAVDQPSGPAIAGWFDRQIWLSATDAAELLGTHLRIADDVVLASEAQPSAKGWEAVDQWLRQTSGVRWEIPTDDATARLLGALTGDVPLDAAVRVLAAAYAVEPGDCARQVVPVVRDLIARGLLLPG